MKKFMLIGGSLFAAIIALTAISSGVQAQSNGGRDCDSNAVIYCGALTRDEMKQKYTANAPGDLDNVFAKYGISAADMGNLAGAREGRVFKDGRVEVDGKVVATGAQTVGRENMPGSTAVNIDGKTYYQRAPGVSFRQESLPAFVMLKSDGSFDFAIIQSCGNPVIATPVEQPKPQTAECVSLKATKINRNSYRFDAVANVANGAGVNNYTFDFGDNNRKTVIENSQQASTAYTYGAPGTFTAAVTVAFTVDGQLISKSGNACKVQVIVEKEPVKPVEVVTVTPCPVPGKQNLPKDSPECKEDVAPAAIPKTGPAQLLGAGVGLSSLTAAGYYWNLSRRNVVHKLLNR